MPQPAGAAPTPLPADPSAADLFALHEARRLLQGQLVASTLRWFENLSGLPLHVVWHDPLVFGPSGAVPLACPNARSQQRQINALPAPCQMCIEQRWRPATLNSEQPQCFTGHCGRANCCAVVQWETSRPLVLVLQAGISSARCLRKAALTSTNAPAFQRAVTLLRWLHGGLQSTLQNFMLQKELARARLRLQNFETEEARLRKALHHRIPEMGAKPVRGSNGTRAQQIVQVMLDYVHEHYQRPMSLGEVAQALDMNASYLSDLFSRTAGITFHHYLDELRLARAETLLRDPRLPVCEVASAAGYASAAYFRQVFKHYHGLPPSRWKHQAALPGI
jgi:AraC-like DNA-binding protein